MFAALASLMLSLVAPHARAAESDMAHQPDLLDLARPLTLTAENGRRARAWHLADLKPDTVYILRLRVRSDSRVVVRLGALAMSYHDQGAWQQLTGIARSSKEGALRISVTLSALQGETPQAAIDDVRIAPYPFTETAPSRRASHAATDLADAVIVYPDTHRTLAERLAAALADRLELDIPIVSDVDATEPDAPVLRDAYAQKHLILLGRLDSNRAMWPAYNRFLAATDGYYPGGDGYVVRTACNVLHNKRNHVILGGSSSRGVERAVDTFINKLDTPKLPWLLDVELGGDCLEACRQRDALWTNEPDSRLLAPVQPGYGTVRRWYENAMGYYWTGWDSYRDRAVEYLRPVLEDKAYTHQYLVEFLIRTWDMLDDSPLFTDADRAAVDRLIADNFEQFLLGHDLTWMTIFSPPYDSIRLTNRHQVAPWYADLMMADFLHDTFELDGPLRDLVAFRRSEKHAVFRHLVDNRWAPSPPGAINGSQCHEEIVATMFRYALEQQRYDFLTSGRAHRALALDYTDHRTGSLVRPADRQDHPLLLGIMANYTRDARYAQLRDLLPHSEHMMGPFQGRYVCNIRKYTPGELPPADASLDAWAGLRRPALSDHARGHIAAYAQKPFARTEVGEPFNFAAFRGGFDADDDYLAVSGLAAHCPPGAILRFSSHDVTWLLSGGENYFDANGLHVQRTDTWSNETSPYAAVAETIDAGDNTIAFALEPFCGMRWERRIERAAPHTYIVRDRVVARENGTYRVLINWHPNARPQWEGDHWLCRADKATLRITPYGRAQRMADATAARFGEQVTLRAGEAAEWATVLQSYVDEPSPVTLNEPAVQSATGGDVATSPWQTQWSYTGLHRPAQANIARRIDADTVDLGRVAPLAAIRANSRRGGAWFALTLPETIELSQDGETWQRIDTPRTWRPGTRTGNYGETHPVDEDVQQINLDGEPARYIRGKYAAEWLYFVTDETAARRPMRVEVTEDGAHILVKPRIWPRFLRRSREEDDALALLTANGVEQFTHEATRNFQEVALIDHFGDGRQQVTTIERDGKLKAFDAHGNVVRAIDLYELHAQYNKQFGKPNTRHPAGGMVMPYGLGAWRGEAGEPSPLVIARYGALSFINSDNSLAGPLMISGYVYPSVLPRGIDLDGNGVEEQLVLGRGVVMRVRGDSEPYVTDPEGHLFYPQVYRFDRLLEPAWTDNIDGPETFVFEPISFGGATRYVAIVRSNYVGVYDGKEHAWAFAWSPLTSLRAATVVASDENALTLACAAADGLVWQLRFAEDLSKPADVNAAPFPDTINAMSARDGEWLIAAGGGLYLNRTRIAEGAFTDATCIGADVIAVDGVGTVHRLTSP